MQYPENLNLTITDPDEKMLTERYLIITSSRTYFQSIVVPFKEVKVESAILSLINFINKAWNSNIKDSIKKSLVNSLLDMKYESDGFLTQLIYENRDISPKPIVVFDCSIKQEPSELDAVKKEINLVIKHLFEYLQQFDKDLSHLPIPEVSELTTELMLLTPITSYKLHYDFELHNTKPVPTASIRISLSSDYGYPGDMPLVLLNFTTNEFNEEEMSMAQLEIATQIRTFRYTSSTRQKRYLAAALEICARYAKKINCFKNYDHEYQIQLRELVIESIIKYNKHAYDSTRAVVYADNIEKNGYRLMGDESILEAGKLYDKVTADSKYWMKELIDKINAQLRVINPTGL